LANTKNIRIHERAVQRGKNYLRSEREVIESIQEVYMNETFKDYNCRSLFHYVETHMGLSYPVAASFITVAKKALEVPELKRAIDSGKLPVQKARKITPVITKENQSAWLDLAGHSSQQVVEKEVAKAKPEAAHPDRAKYISGSHLTVTSTIPEDVYEMQKRVQDLESQRLRRAAKHEDILRASYRAYLEKHDPLEKAKRAQARREKFGRASKRKFESDNTKGEALKNESAKNGGRQDRNSKPESIRSTNAAASVLRQVPNRKHRIDLPAELRHQINLRDQTQCTQTDSRGNRCAEKRWLHHHHIIPIHLGGANTPENITTLCSSHHRQVHEHEI